MIHYSTRDITNRLVTQRKYIFPNFICYVLFYEFSIANFVKIFFIKFNVMSKENFSDLRSVHLSLMNTERFIFAVRMAIGMVSYRNSDLFGMWAAQGIDVSYKTPNFSAAKEILEEGHVNLDVAEKEVFKGDYYGYSPYNYQYGHWGPYTINDIRNA